MLRKLFIIIMGIFLVICAGACNLYPLYLKIMMDKFNFSLKQVNLYGTFINLGMWIALPMGWIYDRFGPKFSCLIGALFLSGSYMCLHFIFNSDVSPPFILFLFIALIMGQGSALCYTTSVTTNLKNFRFKESSAIVGLLVANLALSPSVFTTYRQALKDVQTPTYFMIIAIFILLIITICTFIFHNIRNVYPDADEEKKTYQKYKEKKIIKFLIYLNILILIVYTFGVIFHSVWEDDTGTSKFPLIIIYPCLQLLNFIVIVFEKFGFFDKMYFKPYIDKMIVKQINNEKGNIYKINENLPKEGIGPDDVKVELDKLEKNKNIVEEPSPLQSREGSSSSLNIVSEGEFTEVKLTEKVPSDQGQEQENSINNNLSIGNTISSKEISEEKNDTIDIVSPNSSGVNMYIGKSSDKLESILNKGGSREDSQESQNRHNNQINMNNREMMNLSQPIMPAMHDDNINVSFKEAVLSHNVIILFIILFLGVGSEISNLNNIEFIVMSVSKNPISSNIDNQFLSNTTIINSENIESSTNSTYYPQANHSTNLSKSSVIYSYVILYFVFNSFTRIVSGLILDHLIKIKKFFYYLVLATIFGLVSQFLGIFMDKTLLLISISLAGACHGGYSTFIPVFVRNEFGLNHMGKILGVLTTGNALGSLLIADGIFIFSYNSYANPQGECYGSRCFVYSYITTTCFFLINLGLSFILLRNYLIKVKNN
jgi:MFS family permease